MEYYACRASRQTCLFHKYLHYYIVQFHIPFCYLLNPDFLARVPRCQPLCCCIAFWNRPTTKPARSSKRNRIRFSTSKLHHKIRQAKCVINNYLLITANSWHYMTRARFNLYYRPLYGFYSVATIFIILHYYVVIFIQINWHNFYWNLFYYIINFTWAYLFVVGVRMHMNKQTKKRGLKTYFCIQIFAFCKQCKFMTILDLQWPCQFKISYFLNK